MSMAGAAVAAFGLACALSNPVAAAGTAAEPLNVLFIAIDDLRPELGAYGNVGSMPAETRPPTPEEVRRSLFERAVAARQLRPRRPSDADSTRGASGVAASTGPAGATELNPYGPEQVEEDRRAAEQAAQQLGGRPQAAAAAPDPVVQFASFGGAPASYA